CARDYGSSYGYVMDYW
nr:immunoglobulin heavy chain junction region [Mus musculus]MBK4184072.1 immunoglobulin heavy chain junction region [Mus musculus]MBK4184073.1 immunoglobulin heavy chain junction region [Mus musculus]MBK4184074.1 immunoglobulin heavy chain junction region [Mus musculus]MBK4184075.1 immunoglobulin heavy chain junction region [Mus musculus]